MRKCGILLHPTSLPGGCGIGDLGPWAFRFADFLAQSGVSHWQVLPLGPPGFGNSPYQCFSSMAGNPLMISLESLAAEGWIAKEELEPARAFPACYVDFDLVIPFKTRLLKKAARAFFSRCSADQRHDFEQFCEEKGSWLDRYTEFVALKEMNRGATWTEWHRRSRPNKLRVREQQFMQYQFFRQWAALKNYCRERRLGIIGDIPIFVAYDSADVWANPELFDLDERGLPRSVAGVPPDYFSATGQLWGNPLYSWSKMSENGYRWWIDRIRAVLETVDLLRIDHFRGFEKYYAIPGGSKTAVHGRWLEGPGDSLFAALKEALGHLPFIAEDLGYITPEVHALRDRWGFPGMRILQFAFTNESPSDYFKPYNYIPNCVAYTGTHDNDTCVGWFKAHAEAEGTQSAEQIRAEREFALRYFRSDGKEIHWDFISLAISSAADTAIIPMQDVLGLDSGARMNKPAKADLNWRWRMLETQLETGPSARLHLLNRTYGRLPT
jgi:4-alpha-glucanotransferase